MADGKHTLEYRLALGGARVKRKAGRWSIWSYLARDNSASPNITDIWSERRLQKLKTAQGRIQTNATGANASVRFWWGCIHDCLYRSDSKVFNIIMIILVKNVYFPFFGLAFFRLFLFFWVLVNTCSKFPWKCICQILGLDPALQQVDGVCCLHFPRDELLGRWRGRLTWRHIYRWWHQMIDENYVVINATFMGQVHITVKI